MKSLVGDLLDFAQLQNGKFRKVEEFFNIRKVINEVISIQEYKAKKKGISIQTTFKNFDRDILNEPVTSCISEMEEDELYMICSDEQRIIQVVLNLLSNALKFTSKDDRIYITCEIKVIDGLKYISISVEDTGIGISKNDQKKLFKMFGYLESSNKQNTQGIGLGLYISQKIVETFEGDKIELESEVGIGTKFTFKFKLNQDMNHQI